MFHMVTVLGPYSYGYIGEARKPQEWVQLWTRESIPILQPGHPIIKHIYMVCLHKPDKLIVYRNLAMPIKNYNENKNLLPLSLTN